MLSAIYSRGVAALQLPSVIRLEWHVGDVVRKLRERQGLTSQEALGERVSEHDGKKAIDKGTINRLEVYGERRSKSETISRVAGALGVEVSDLYASVPRQRDATEAVTLTPEQEMVLAKWTAATNPESRALALEYLERGSQAQSPPSAELRAIEGAESPPITERRRPSRQSHPAARRRKIQ